MYEQLSLLESPATPSQSMQPQLDIDFGIWCTRYGSRPWGWEGYGNYEHLHGAKYQTKESAIAAAVATIINDPQK